MDKFFFGSAISSVDQRGAIVLPAAFIETLKQRQRDGVLYVGRHEDGQRLVVYDQTYFENQQASVYLQNGNLAGGTNYKLDQFLQRTFTFVEKVELTDLGQIAIGPIMRERGGIGSAILIVGAGHHFELWDLHTVLEGGPYDLRWVAQRHIQAQAIADQDTVSSQRDVQPMPMPVALARKKPAISIGLAKMNIEPLPNNMVGHRGIRGGRSI